MPRLFPPDPRFPADGGAERGVWEALRDHLPDEAAVFSGLRVLEGAQEFEIDLLVAWPGVGLAAIEVKGGFIRRVGGQWLQGSGPGEHAIDPVGQVQGARHALQHLLDRRGVPKARTAHLVAFPHIPVPDTWESLDLPRIAVLDRDDVGSGERLAARLKTVIETHGQGYGPLAPRALEHLIEVLADGFPSQAENLIAASIHETHIEQMTRDQAKLLTMFTDFPRFHIIGGAGTGKTWLALEQARRQARAGKEVALLCYSRGLGRFFERITQTWPSKDRPAYVGLFHDLPLMWGAEPGTDDDPDYWERRLPTRLGELAAERDVRDKFDAVVVDEAQDFGDLWWPPLLDCLRDPGSGGLFVFGDEAQRVFDRDGKVPIDLPPVRLEENLRSTKQIAQVFGSLSDEMLRPRGPDGPAVRMIDVESDDAVSMADDAVDALLEEGWEPGQIALLTTYRRHPQQVNEVELGGHAAYWDAFFAQEDVFYGHVLGFKGLERTVVVLAINGVRDMERAKELLYTGMSRARSLLVIVGKRAAIEEVGGEGVVRRLARAEEWAPPRVT